VTGGDDPGEEHARDKWNDRYARDSSVAFPDAPADWLVEHRPLIAALAPGGRALDVACGDGRNARYLAELGFAVEALDVSDVVIRGLRAAAPALRLDVTPRAVDLEAEPGLPADTYDVIVNFNYLQRSLFGALEQALRPGGLLFFETFATPHVDELGHDFPAAFVLADNELLRAFPALHVRAYFEGVAARSGRPRGIASLVAQRRARSPRGSAQPRGTSGRPART
jgi:tellurite methyltransferase